MKNDSFSIDFMILLANDSGIDSRKKCQKWQMTRNCDSFGIRIGTSLLSFPSLYSADSPPWRRDLYDDLKAPRTPAYNTSVGQADKAKHVAQNPPLNGEAERWIDAHFRDRWRSVRGVDDMIALLVEKLGDLGGN